MNGADEAIFAAFKEAKSLRKTTQKKKTIQVKGSERDIIRATALSWFNNHRKQVTAVFSNAELGEIDKRYQWVLQASHKGSLRSSYIDALKEIADLLVALRSVNVIKLSTAPPALPTADTPPDFSSVSQDAEMKKILESRWIEITLCLAANSPLAATVMMGGLLEGVIFAKIECQTNKVPIYTAVSAPRDRNGKTLHLNAWTLLNYIGVAHELKWITQPVKDISEVLRDYRNYIHPKKQHLEKMSLSPEDGKILWEITKSIARQVLTP
jgi:hypothetical protein